MKAPSCMGGWGCALRDRCALHLADDRRFPAERLCSDGAFEAFVPIAIKLCDPSRTNASTTEETARCGT